MLRLIHTADWQLGKPFGRFPAEIRTALGEARFDAIDRIGALARERRAGHVVVAGDVFDSTGPADRDIVQAVTRMGKAPCTWWLMPGNHDHARSDGLWARVRRAAPANVRVVDTPEPVELEEGAWLLPAPLEHRRTRDDPTSAYDGMSTPDGAVRIGLAHGSIVDFGSRGEADNMIPPDRAQRSGLDYLALGDWHGFLTIGDRTAYSGTPEIDRFGRDDLFGGSCPRAALARCRRRRSDRPAYRERHCRDRHAGYARIRGCIAEGSCRDRRCRPEPSGRGAGAAVCRGDSGNGGRVSTS